MAGIGINVNHTDFPRSWQSIGTSLRMDSGRTHSREALLTRVLAAIDRYTELLRNEGKAAILDQFSRTFHRMRMGGGHRGAAEGDVIGITAGLDASGFLYVDAGQTENGF